MAPANGMSWVGYSREGKLCGLLHFFNFQNFLISFFLSFFEREIANGGWEWQRVREKES